MRSKNKIKLKINWFKKVLKFVIVIINQITIKEELIYENKLVIVAVFFTQFDL